MHAEEDGGRHVHLARFQRDQPLHDGGVGLAAAVLVPDLAQQIELAQFGNQLSGELVAAPVLVHDGRDVLVHELPGGVGHLTLVAGQGVHLAIKVAVGLRQFLVALLAAACQHARELLELPVTHVGRRVEQARKVHFLAQAAQGVHVDLREQGHRVGGRSWVMPLLYRSNVCDCVGAPTTVFTDSLRGCRCERGVTWRH